MRLRFFTIDGMNRTLWFSFALLVPVSLTAQQPLTITRSTIAEGTEEWDMTQARTAFSPENGVAITTMSRTAKKGAHGFHDVYLSVSRDHGETWSEPEAIPSLHRRVEKDGYEIVPGDLWPQWNPDHRTFLITGKQFNFAEGSKEDIHREKVVYAVMDPNSLKCGPMRVLELPEKDHDGGLIIAPNSGCHQRFDEEKGWVVLPIRYQKTKEMRIYTSVVANCEFDGETLKYMEHGTGHSIPRGRGLYEPSVWKFGGEFFLTLRADDGAWVTKSSNGLYYFDHIPWKFDDGEPLGSYHTQQHWADIGGRLYLIYTRKGANNDHIMRHRAPLFIAEVDPEKLRVIRATEQILVPENQATLGNSGVCHVSDTETWVTVAEGRVSYGERAGENNKVILARIRQPE